MLALGAAACATTTQSVAPATPAPPTFEQKMAWVLRMEDQRVLRDTAPAIPPAPPPVAGKKGAIVVPPPPPPLDLIHLLSDSEARVRRRAALAVGHVGLREGVPALVGVLHDEDPEVRQMAAFALGLLGDKAAREPLVAALSDPSPVVQASAAEALGLIGDPVAAEAIGRLVTQIVQSGAVSGQVAADEDTRRDSPAGVFRLGVSALVRLKAFDQLAAAVLDASGQPRVRWWPVAYALQRLENPRALAALLALIREQHPYTRAFAAKGLGALKNPAAVPALLPLLSGGDQSASIEAVRALARIGDPAAAAPLMKRLQTRGIDAHLRLEIVMALGSVHAANVPGVSDALIDSISDPSPQIRAAALASAATLDPEGFVPILSSLDPDPDWTVRAALAGVLGTLASDTGLPRLMTMLNDGDARVVPKVIESLVKVKAPTLEPLLLDRLKAADPVVRAAAAAGLGELKPPSGPEALNRAFVESQRDASYTARAAILAALAKYGAAAAGQTLRTALADKDWAVRVRAAMLLKQLDPAAGATVDAAIRPAPTMFTDETYQADRLIVPQVSTQLFIDTDRGTIQIELAVLDAPLTIESITGLARKGFFDGSRIHRVEPDFVLQAGDPRGDGEGGPGFTMRDELNERPYVRGTVGVALDPWPDTGGSQFFVTLSPQPHLDAKYTVFGRVIAGMDVADRIERWDVIRRIRVWNGKD
jgi:HEAT repeat protein/cyclophilin family peptidyl-prolyl cis-trans isomerase